MLSKHPKRIPQLADMLADLGNPTDAAVAKALGVSERMAKQWRKKDDAPRTVLLALFWVTSWGQQWADAETFNRAQLDYQTANALRRRNKELEQIIARLMSLADFGSANDLSFYGVSGQRAPVSHALEPSVPLEGEIGYGQPEPRRTGRIHHGARPVATALASHTDRV